MFKKLVGVFLITLLMLAILINFAGPGPVAATTTSWDWNGIIGTGQSLAVGGQASVVTTTQPYNNLKLSLGGLTVPPYDSTNSALTMIPLVEVNNVVSYPAPYPKNLFGETPHSAMANQITYLTLSNLGKDYITAHSIVGEAGQGIVAICKGATDTGSTGRAYAASLFEVSAIKRLAAAAGKTYGVGAILLTHGETDNNLSTYKDDIIKLWDDYNQDIKALTGQTETIPMLVSQQHAYPTSGTASATQAQWEVGLDYPGSIICTGPKYQYPYYTDGVHMVAGGYQQLGEKYAQVYYERVICGNDWQPLQPTSATQSGNVITVNFHVPALPLVWDTTMTAPNQSNLTEWKNGKGFEVSAGGSRITISSVAISGGSVVITCASTLPTSGVTVGYAYTAGGTIRTNGTARWGLLRDSDSFTGKTSGVSQPNYCVAFQVSLPYNATVSSPSPAASASPSPTVATSVSAAATPTLTATVTPTVAVTPTATASNGGCSVSYTQFDWGSGATVNITIKNNGTTAINGWQLAWNFPGSQKITNMWNATFTQSGTAVTATNQTYNSSIPVGASVSLGFNLSYSGTNAEPTSFTLNEITCEVQ